MISGSSVVVAAGFLRRLKQTGPAVTGSGVQLPFSALCRSTAPPAPGAKQLEPESTAPPASGYSRHGQMPRKEKVKGQSKGAAGAVAETQLSGPVTQDRTGAVAIAVHVKPGSKHSSITDVSSEAVGVSIAAPPTDGEANTELIRYLAEALDLKKSHISLDKGSRSRDKLIKVDSSLSPEEVLRRLQQAAG